MDLREDFGRLRKFVGGHVLPRTFAQKVITELEFFETAIANPDHVTENIIKLRWSIFKNTLRGTGLYEQFRKVALNWSAIESWVGENGPTSGASRSVTKNNRGSYASFAVEPQVPSVLDAEDFFERIFSEINKSLEVRGPEKFILLFGVKYLLAEAQRPKPRRDHRFISFVWLTVQPMLRRRGFLDRYEGHDLLKERVRAFVRGNM
jgi:hypothetical protein